MGEAFRSFFRGFGSIIDIAPSSPYPEQPDFLRDSIADRLGSDWARVGKHLQRAVEAHEGEVNGTREHTQSGGTSAG